MSDVLQALAGCERITEWIDPWDARLAVATGENLPADGRPTQANDGGAVRDFWEIEPVLADQVAAGVRRLLIPPELKLRGLAQASFRTGPFGPGTGNVIVDFSNGRDWADCFPANDRTAIFQRVGRQAWAAVALCAPNFGLAVFSKENSAEDCTGVEVRVQPVPEAVLERILLAV